MSHKRATKKQLREWIDEEIKASEMYYEYGFDEQARDEFKHAMKFKNVLKRRGS